MNSILLTLIVFKVICLFVCWKGVSMARKASTNKNQKVNQSTYSSNEVQDAQIRMNQLMEQNKQLSEAIHEMKSTQSSKLNVNKKESL